MLNPRIIVFLIGTSLALGLMACGGSSGTPPTITVQPQDQTVGVGAQATFSVTATGTMTLMYQWSKNGMSIPGATAASYTTPATTLVDDGSKFSVVVSNGSGSVTSNTATLHVVPTP